MMFLVLLVISIITILIVIIISFYKKVVLLTKENKELSNQNELKTTLINNNNDFVYLKDGHLKYVFVNDSLKKYFEYYNEEAIGLDDSKIMGEEFATLFENTDLEVLKKKMPVTYVKFWENRFFKTVKFPVSMVNGSLGIGAYITDITKEQRKNEIQERMIKHNKLLLEVLTRNFKDKQEQLDYALHELLKISGSQYGYIYFYNEEKEEFILNSWTKGVMKECTVKGEPKIYKLENMGIWGEVVRQRTYIIENDFEKFNPLKKGYPTGHVKLKKYMSVPVIIDDKIVAVVGFANKQTNYNETDVNEMSMLMSGVWNAVQRRESAKMLFYERNKYYQILLSIGDGVIVLDIEKNIEVMNSTASNLTGWLQEEAIGKPYDDVFRLGSEKNAAIIEDSIGKVYKTKKAQEIKDNTILTSKSGEQYSIEYIASPILNDRGFIDGVVLVFRDVTEENEHRKRIEFLSFRDSLTGLYNRHFFEEELRRLDTKRNLPISILMGDVNGLKLINDIFGHTFGDMFLKKIASTLQSVCRDDDIIARWGGDEFVIILPKTDYKGVKKIAERIKDMVSRQQVRAIKCSISIGFYTKVKVFEDIVRVLDKAETQMYLVKTLESYNVKKNELDKIIDFFIKNNEEESQHAIRVKELCLKTGKALNLSKSDLKRLVEAAELHDIGKVVLEASLLRKRGPLSEKESKEIKEHPVIGYRILNYFEETQDLAEIVIAHHENWDGSGYPKGLMGKSIPFLARIVSVVDAYDNILNKSNHIMDKNINDEAVYKIKQLSGIKLDPYISRIFTDLIRFKET
ncbi:MAG: diguanylate cyclase [Clostridiales bacterium]|jgi:diguanylate cyclase (GGDEF)-like protein/PAS domain S-box-containing protein|nr:diguanylate cyclase [Clostridiales bacterium]